VCRAEFVLSFRAPRNFGERILQSFLTFGIPVALLNGIFERKEHSVPALILMGILEALGSGFCLAILESLYISIVRHKKT
jgi:hypothetical protein